MRSSWLTATPSGSDPTVTAARTVPLTRSMAESMPVSSLDVYSVVPSCEMAKVSGSALLGKVLISLCDCRSTTPMPSKRRSGGGSFDSSTFGPPLGEPDSATYSRARSADTAMPRGRRPTAMVATTLPATGSTTTTLPPLSSETYRRSSLVRPASPGRPRHSRPSSTSAATARRRAADSSMFMQVPMTVPVIDTIVSLRPEAGVRVRIRCVGGNYPRAAPRERYRCRAYRRSVEDDTADRLAGVHQVKGVIDLVERHLVRDQRIDCDLAVHVPVDDLRHVGATACPAESRTLPDPPGHELERARGDLLACPGDTDDDGHAPAAMAAFERLAHQLDVADAFEAVVGAAVGERHQVRHQIALYFLRIDEMC